MGMQIATNVAALNAQRNLAVTGVKMGKVLEKLSSGFRINRAADDAAGLGTSEKMRAQIRGSAQAVRNAQDGISMLQTAESALAEVHSILQRVRELSVLAANGTYAENGAERTSIGQEIKQLKDEIDQIVGSTQFNGQNPLTGTLTGTLGGATGTDLVVGDQLATTADVMATETDVTNAKAQTYTFTSGGARSITLTGADDKAQTLSGLGSFVANESKVYEFSSLGVKLTLQAGAAAKTIADTITDLTAAVKDTIVVTGSGAAQLQIGANNGENIAISFNNMQTSQLGAGSDLNTLIADNTNVDTIAEAEVL